MTNLRTDEIVFFRNLTKIGTDENKAIYSIRNYWRGFYFRVSMLSRINAKIKSSRIKSVLQYITHLSLYEMYRKH